MPDLKFPLGVTVSRTPNVVLVIPSSEAAVQPSTST
jgi:hypothetical protein